jgi:endonuclease G, mitochondrial
MRFSKSRSALPETGAGDAQQTPSMTVITPASEYVNPDESDPRRDAALRRRVLEEQQIEALRRRVAERAEVRQQREEAIASSSSLADVNTPEVVARRLDRITRYYAGDELPETTPTEAPDQLAEKAVERHPVPNSTAPEKLLEAIINTADFLGTRYLDAGVAAARAVGRILIKDDRGRLIGYGTGSMISPQLMLTNHHVLDSPQAAATSQVEFDYQDGIDGKLLDVTTFSFAPDRFFLADEALDFAIVAVGAAADQLAPFGFNRLIESEGKALLGEFVTIVQHPRGDKKQVVLRENQIVDGGQHFVHYSADTEPGSSGSPVFNDQWEVLALHHASVRATEHPEFGNVLNEGVRVTAILSAIKYSELLPEQRALADAILHPPTEERTPSTATPQPVGDSPASIKIPLTLDVTLPPGAAASLSVAQQTPEPPAGHCGWRWRTACCRTR